MRALLVMLLSLALGSAASADIVDDLENGQGSWNGAVAGVVAGQGVGGSAALQVDTAAGNGGKWIVYEDNLFTGDLSGGTAFTFEITPDPNAAVQLRFAFGNTDKPNSGGSWWVAKTPVDLPAGAGGFQTVSFTIDESAFTQTQGSDSFADTLATVAAIRILHNPVIDARGARITATHLVDNVTLVEGPGARSCLEQREMMLASGWNALGLSYALENAATASELLNDLRTQGIDAEVLSVLVDGKWQVHVGGLPINDFALMPDTAYFVYSDTGGRWGYTLDLCP